LSTELNCIRCGGAETQRLSVAYESGISDINTSGTTTGLFASGNGLGIGGGSTRTRGTAQTALSQRAAPPAKKRYLKPLLLIGLLLPFILPYLFQAILPGKVGNLIAEIIYVGCLLGWIAFALRYNTQQWPPLKAIWDRSFICLRCGTTFQPEGH